MRTAEEVVEEIMDEIIFSDKDLSDKELTLEVAQALTAYAEERVKEDLLKSPWIKEHRKQARAEGIEEGRREKQAFYDASVKDHYLEGKADGRAEALEEAATVAQFYSAPEFEHRVTPWAAGDIADRIRALKEKPYA